MSVPTLTFKNGQKMPAIGLGTWQITDHDEMEKALSTAIDVGYRHIDTAFVYKNEKAIGDTLQKLFKSGKVKREELFIVTKLPEIGLTPENVAVYLSKSLTRLQLDYADLYLMHTPIGKVPDETGENTRKDQNGVDMLDLNTDILAVWKAMENEVVKGRARSIGVSNFTIEQIERISKNSKIQPSNVQVEIHAYLQQKELRETCRRLGITVCAYAPLCSPGLNTFIQSRGGEPIPLPDVLKDPTVLQLAAKHNKTAGQILLRFLVQLGMAVIPKSSNPARIKENFQIFDFELDSEDVSKLEKLERGARIFLGYPGSEEHPEYPFK